MAYAPWNNSEVRAIGQFTEKEFGKVFEVSENPEFMLHPDLKTGRNTQYPHLVWVTDPIPRIDCGYRVALVKKTVAYVVVDENDDGWVIEKWNIKNCRPYKK
jgi:hypothetical protein